MEAKAQTIDEMRFRLLINSMNDAVIALDGDGKVLLYNAATLDLLNRNTSLEGHKITGALKLYDQDQKLFDLHKFITGIKGACTSRDYLLKVDDSFMNVYLNICPVYSGFGHDEDRSYIMLLRDITKEKSLEEERDEFISVVSHELRTPVAIAEGNVGNAQFMAHKLKADKTITDALDQAHAQILFLSDLLNDLSMLSRAERGRLKLTLETIDMKSLLEELQTTYLPEAGQHGLKLSVKTEGKLPKVKNSELYVREILQNFITNSLKYTQKGGVSIKAKTVGKGTVEITVSDTGIGMSAHDLKHIFEKFYRSEDYRTRESSGTGLGLYVTRRLIDLTGATLDVTSKLNHGSNFIVTFPSLDEAVEDNSEEESLTQGPAKEPATSTS